ncbi:zinc finger protein [Hirschfeldia incana]|nr:zinc finger protein [Hirschfeldia incana]
MGTKWRKMKLALGLNLCTYLPRTLDESPPALNSTERLSDVALLSPLNWPMTPTPSSHGLKLSRNSSRKSSKTCSICLTKMKEGGGHALFTAECSHSFHFHCIASNVKHGNQVCPVCRAKWKEIPMQHPPPPYLFARPCSNDAAINLLHRLPTPRRVMNQGRALAPEPSMFNDDEPLEQQLVFSGKSLENNDHVRMMELKIYPEVSAVPRAESREKFDVLVHLRAAGMVNGNARAPLDLVTVLDISGSMAGTKLALLKKAMGFVIQNLGSNDRLSVIAFSSTARRLFPLTKMSDAGRNLALQAVNSLVANGGTNIAEGLRKGVKVMEERRDENPVASVILLSDGRDTYTMNNQPDPNYKLLLPLSMHGRFQIPVHSFGFGSDHDASLMHSVSEASGGTFSFIESEAVIQDALAQCIGGLLSVAVQELRLEIDGFSSDVRLRSIKAGSYPSLVGNDGRSGRVDIGDLYADEERDFLMSINIPPQRGGEETELLKMRCVYKDLLTKEVVTLQSHVLKIQRPDTVGQEEAVVVSIEVDRQRNRFLAAEAMAKARGLAEGEDLAAAVTVIQEFRQVLAETVSAKSNDGFCVALDREMKEMQERMASRHVYEVSGRAYILSGLSSHSWQRATSRGESGDGCSFVQAYSYQTPSMVEMLHRSQATSYHRLIQPLLSYVTQPKPR